MSAYTVPEQFAGKSLNQINNMNYNGQNFSADEVASRFGISPDQPLTAGQTFTSDWNDPGHGSYQYLQKYFNPQSDSAYAMASSLAQQNQAIAPAVSSLKEGIPLVQQQFGLQGSYLQGQQEPLKARYDNLLNSILNQGSQMTNQATTNLATEYGKRGVPLQSGVFDQNLANIVNPIKQNVMGQYTTASLGRESDLAQLQNLIAKNPIEQAQAENQIRQAIATLEAGAGKDAITNALDMTKWSDKLAIDRETLQNNLQIAKLQNETKQQVTQVGDKYYVFDPSSGNLSMIGQRKA